MDKRIICLIDMDCFYVQCEQRLQPEKWGKPCGVSQYNQWRGGGVIAVNYEARAFGVKRGMRTEDCLKLCPEYHNFIVPERNGKAELTRYRDCSSEVFDCIVEYIQDLEQKINKKNLIIFEKASVDEAYIDFTKYINEVDLKLPSLEEMKSFNCKAKVREDDFDKWYASLCDNFNEDVYRLVMGAYYIGTMRKRIHEKTQFRCSAGISVNKMLAKLACGVNKPNAQTILPFSSVPMFFASTKISDVRSLGGKAGDQVKEMFSIQTMGELSELELSSLRTVFDDKHANWLYMLGQGIDEEVVTSRRLSKSIGCGKQFPGQLALASVIQIQDWSKVLCEELIDRLETDRKTNKRIAKLLTINYVTEKKGSTSKSMAIRLKSSQEYPDPNRLSMEIFRTVFQDLKQIEPILNLSFSASKFVEISSNQGATIHNFFSTTTEPPLILKRDKPSISEQEIFILDDNPESKIAKTSNKDFEEYEDSFFFKKIQQLYQKGKLLFLDE